MKSKTRLIAAAVAAALCFQSCVATAIFAQAAGGALDRRQVDALLVEARKAMDRTAYDRADSLIKQAEKANIRYSLFHFGDTPQRVRKDLDKIRAKNPASRTPRPNLGGMLPSKTQSSASVGPTSAGDPFLTGSSGSVFESPLGTNPPIAQSSTPSASGSQPSSPVAPTQVEDSSQPTSTARVASDAELLAARRALAVGDVRRAREHAEKATSHQVAYEFNEDSPAKVDTAIGNYVGLTEQRKEGQPTEAWNRQYASLLTEQAEAMLKWKDYAQAERLATDASRLGVNFGPYVANPQDLLKRIADVRKNATLPIPPTAATELAAADVPATGKQKAVELLGKARQALDRGDPLQAQQRVDQAIALGVPDSEFGEGEDRPWLLALQVQKARAESANVVTATRSPALDTGRVDLGVYNSEGDTTYNTPAAYDALPVVKDGATTAVPKMPAGESYGLATDRLAPPVVQIAQAAVPSNLQPNQAAQSLSQATQPRPQNGQPNYRVAQAAPTGEGSTGSSFDGAAAGQQVLARQFSAEVARRQASVRNLRQTQPRRALESLQQIRATVVAATGLDSAARAQLLRRIDRSVRETEKYIEDNLAQIELDESNRNVLGDIDRRRQTKIVIEQELAELIDQFNRLRDEQRYAEMEVVAKRARELAPDEPVVQQLWLTARFIRREIMNRQLAENKESGVFDALQAVDDSSIAFDDRKPFQYGDVKVWERLTARRARSSENGRHRMSEQELEIERKLSTPVMLEFIDRPLSEVIDQLGNLAGINIHLDPLGMAEEGIPSDFKVTIKLRNEVMLKSALKLILDPLNLSYVIKDEVLKITSEQLRDGEVFNETYPVADLVIPIPNFVPGGQFGMQAAINQGYNGALAARGGTSNNPMTSAGPTAVVQNGADGQLNPNVLGAVPGMPGMQGMGGGGVVTGGPQQLGMGPGGMGGGAQADFDSLIELITATIQPDSWDDVGGAGSVQPFETNLSLVVSQTQEVHEQIVDLLEQLRRMQDLQVTIEVRFITLSDQFFERIGIDFDFQIEDGDFRTAAELAVDRVNPSTTVGFENGAFTADLDIPFRQDSFASTVPAFGGGTLLASTGANFGFAILSDIEAFFLIQAAQGDSRSSILQAPKVTLFNGQNATISDTTQRPFVTSVIPVVGDFAAAQQPVIVVLSEGTNLSIQAIVSPDRRYVRLTVVPFFSTIGAVQEFTFEGDTTTTTNSSGTDADDDGNDEETTNDNTVRRQGTTVQLPQFSFVTVNTTVSVPDGGTVLLGGIKRLREAREELGVPLLSKVPYLNRLFSNVGIGRETESLMLMVTPRIIIQEEEEELMGMISTP